MREIKFRCWNEENKKMVYAYPLWKEQTGCVMEGWEDYHADELSEYMQFTGLKDKNGKEIYEGDIICNANSVPLEIYWNEMAGGFWQRTHAEDGTYPTRLDLRFNEKSIIGNIYENPELIKK